LGATPRGGGHNLLPSLIRHSSYFITLDFADLVDTGRVLAEAGPSVVVHLIAGRDVFLDVRNVLFWGSPSLSCVPSCTGLRLDVLGIVLCPVLMCLNVSGEGTPSTGVMIWTA
jgi:hypothetical protein